MQIPSAHAKVGWIGEYVDVLFSGEEERVFREANVVAYTKAKSRKFSFKRRQLSRAWDHVAAFKECYASWYVHIEKMHFAVSGCDLALFVKAEARIEDATIALDQLGNTASDDVRLRLLCQL